MAWVLLPALLFAQSLPEPLEPWQDWVVRDVEDIDCPYLPASTEQAQFRQCVWPGRIRLDVNANSASFELEVVADAESWLDLPGDADHWPRNVLVQGKPVTVLQRQGKPALRLQAGEWLIRGELVWEDRPARLAVPAAIGMVDLLVDGKPLSRIERSKGMLTLGKPIAKDKPARDSLAVRVYRQLADGTPAMLTTKIELDVSGKAREIALQDVLPEGFVGTSLQSGLPARLERGDELLLQVRPGEWALHLVARGTDVLSEIKLADHAGHWPAQEIWSYRDQPALRHTRVEGQPVDAGRAEVPRAWRQLPAFVVDAEHGLVIEQLARGSGAETDLSLRRELWLGFEGQRLLARDHLSGQAGHLHRAHVAAPWQLLGASANGKPVMVTSDGKGQGVEVRDHALALAATLLIKDFSGVLPLAGWQLTLQGIEANLHLPSGYLLLGAPGADSSPDSWVARWNLLELFVAALIALLAGRLLGWPWALVAAGYLLLGGQEWGAPRWSLLLALALALFARALPGGKLENFARLGGRVLLLFAILLFLPFATAQLRMALYPQLSNGQYTTPYEAASQYVDKMADRELRSKAAPPVVVEKESAMAMAPAPPAPRAPLPAILQSVTVSGELASPNADAALQARLELADTGVVQAGPGIPDWDQANNYQLAWQGPVTTERLGRLVIAPAWLVSILRVLMLGLLLALLLRTLAVLLPKFSLPKRHAGAAPALALLLGMLSMPGHAQQAIPDAELRNELRAELLEPPVCAPDCASLAGARLDVAGDLLQVELLVHAGAEWAVPLPVIGTGGELQKATMDGSDAALVRQDEQLLVRVERGIHRVLLQYRLAGTEQATLRFPLPPRQVAFTADGWHAEGIDGATLAGDSIVLKRIPKAGSEAAAKDPVAQAFPPYVRLERHLFLGNEWTLYNSVRRIAPVQDGFSVRLPRLPGAHPLDENVQVDGDELVVTFASGEQQVAWQSRLEVDPQFSLSAPDLARHGQTWQISASPNWHVETSGVPETESDNGRRFLPLPGETLAIQVTRPEPVAGATLAFDRVHLVSSSGAHATETTVHLDGRSTRGGEHSVSLPAGATVLDVQRDNREITVDARDGKLSLPILPGRHEYQIRYRQAVGVGFVTRSASIGLDAPAANLDLELYLPEARWDLLAWGPGVGPAVLYWPLLVVFLLLAWLLGRYAPTPLKFRHWLLLALGFSAFSWAAFLFVVAWLIVLGVREHHWPDRDNLFQLSQVGIALMTLIALAVLVAVIPDGLLGAPDMHIAGNGSTASRLNWFVDRADGDMLPVGSVFSVPLWVYKVAILLWALWLANALIGWLRWGFGAWSQGGYWRSGATQSTGTTEQRGKNDNADGA